MKKLLVFIFALFCSKIAMADGGIPLLIFLGSNLLVTTTLVPPFIFGLLLFWIVCTIEKHYIVKKLNIKQKITRSIVIANLYSTLCGIPLSIILYFVQNKLCEILPYSGSDGHLVCLILGPFLITPIIDLFLLGWMSWFVEYSYLKRKLKHPKLKRVLAFANLYSYIAMTVCAVFLFRLAIYLLMWLG